MFIFIFAGLFYILVELAYRGFTHYSMFILAGICGLVMAGMNDRFSFELDFGIQVFSCTVVCTLMEFIFGEIFNRDYSIWDYRGMWGTFADNQCNVVFVLAWLVLCIMGIPLLDFIEWKVFDEERPYYKLFGKVFWRM